MQPVLDPTSEALRRWLTMRGEPGYRLDQLRRWLYHRRAVDFAAMTDLPKPLRDALATEFSIWTTRVVRHSEAEDGTEKLLLELADGQRIESVLLRDGARRTICISTQVGCGMGCVFCASGLDGVARNLSATEIVEQMLRIARLLPDDERLSHIVVMGMGEPLANLDHLLLALGEATSDSGLGISPRRITVSTVGLPKAIDRLTERQSRFNLAVSLHAADDRLRRELVPTSRAIPLARILAAADRYFESSGRRLTFEYVLLDGVNDRRDDARRLAELLGHRTAMINLIPYNPVAGLPYRRPSGRAVAEFRAALESAGLNVNVRFRKGERIDAACGQLRRDGRVVQLHEPA